MTNSSRRRFIALSTVAVAGWLNIGAARAQTTVTIGIGTQNTTTNTVTTGAVIRELHLLEQYLPKDGKYANINFQFDWENFTSGPPVTNAMMANKLQFGTMGDYPLIVNGFTFQSNPDSKSRLIAVDAYNLYGSGNGVVVHKDSPYYPACPISRAKSSAFPSAPRPTACCSRPCRIAAGRPTISSSSIRARRSARPICRSKKIDAHADFVPFAELLPFRGFARKIFDGAETNLPTWHGVVVRTDFAEKYPEVVVAYIKAIIAANKWVRVESANGGRKDRAMDRHQQGGRLHLPRPRRQHDDSIPTIKPPLIEAAAQDVKVLQNLGRMKDFDVKKWVDDSYIRKAYAELGLDYDAELKKTDNYEVAGDDQFCKKPITEPRKAGEVWVDGEGIQPFSSAACTLGAYADFVAKGKKIDVAYVFDTTRGIKLFADQAFYATGSGKDAIAPFLLKKDAEELCLARTAARS